MTITLDSLLSQLSHVDVETQPLEFEKVLEQVNELNDQTVIVKLTRFFKDDSKYDEVMFSIVHTIESFDLDVYICNLIQATPWLYENAPRWNSILLMRVLNSESAKAELIRQLALASSDTKTCFYDLLTQINQVSPEFVPKTISVLAITK